VKRKDTIVIELKNQFDRLQQFFMIKGKKEIFSYDFINKNLGGCLY